MSNELFLVAVVAIAAISGVVSTYFFIGRRVKKISDEATGRLLEQQQTTREEVIKNREVLEKYITEMEAEIELGGGQR